MAAYSGATITAFLDWEPKADAVASASGSYLMRLGIGTYDLVASAHDAMPDTVWGVVAAAADTTEVGLVLTDQTRTWR